MTSTQALHTRHVTRDQFGEVRRLLLDVYAEVYRDDLDDPFHTVERFDTRLAGYAASPGWAAVIGYQHDEAAGYAFGSPLPSHAAWWTNVRPPLDDQYTAETGQRTFALFELMVREPWRGTGVARQIHDELAHGRPEPRVTLLVDSDHPKVRARYEQWGYHKVAQTRPFPDSPLFDLMVLEKRQT